MKLFRIASFLLIVCLVSGCSEVELASHFGKKIVTGPEAKSKGRYKVGSPYRIKGKKYYPAVDYGYDKTGVASWYGPGFHGKMTANGEIFNENDLTAAHKTLPMPSIVRVTNLENGRSLIVRVNDRGPYAHGRIIDLSKKSAELLGFRRNGIAKVRVQVMEAESRMVGEIARNGKSTRGMEVEMNRPGYKFAKAPSSAKNVPQYSNDVKVASVPPEPVHSVPLVDNISSKFVQVGSYTTRDSAMRVSSALDSYGRSQIYTAVVDGQQYYRVRFLSENEENARMLVSDLVADGYSNAFIVGE